VLATKAVNDAGADGSLALLGVQAVGVVATFAWSGVLSFALFKLVGLITPLRAEEQDEWSGLDMAEAGERAYVSSDLESQPLSSSSHAGDAVAARVSASAAGH
jgi:Amt family ammonium transporter